MPTSKFAHITRARRKDIAKQARCEGCGATLEACEAERGKDPDAPRWLGCCAQGVDLRPCRHVPDPADYAALLDEIGSGVVRTVEEVRAERDEREAKRRARREEREADRAAGRPTSYRAGFEQGEWWKTKDSGWTRIADMAPSHRLNTARFLERRAGAIAFNLSASELAMMADAPEEVVDEWIHQDDDKVKDPVGWLRGTALYRALIEGLDAGEVDRVAEGTDRAVAG